MSACIADDVLNIQQEEDWDVLGQSSSSSFAYDYVPDVPHVPEIEGVGEVPQDFHNAMEEIEAGYTEDFND